MDPAETRIREYLAAYLENCPPATWLDERLRETGVGLFPLVDHVTFRTTDVAARAREFQDLGFVADDALGVLEFDDWWARIYRKPGLPAIFIDQAWAGERGAGSVIPSWVSRFGDRVLHHAAIRVDDIEAAVERMRAAGFGFADEIVGARGGDLRQIFSHPERRDGEPFTVLELAERHRGYAGFLPPQADGLMRSTKIGDTSHFPAGGKVSPISPGSLPQK